MVELLIAVSDKRTTFVGPTLQSAFPIYLVKKQDNEWGNQSTSSISLTISYDTPSCECPHSSLGVYFLRDPPRLPSNPITNYLNVSALTSFISPTHALCEVLMSAELFANSHYLQKQRTLPAYKNKSVGNRIFLK